MTERVDLRSDTVTLPTLEMRRAMIEAELGDDVYGEDPTVTRLEELAASMLGKEAALFVPTGTMANEVAVLTHTARGDEAIVDADSHVYGAEVGGLALLAGVQARPLPSERGLFTLEQVATAIRSDDVHYPRTGLLCLENPHNAAGGVVALPTQVAEVAAVARARGIPVHLDGARIFNGAIALGVPAAELAAPADSVMFCLSKSLCCPVGSVLLGATGFIARARRMRKVLGGGMRQAGVLAAAGIVALETMIERLADDHAHACLLAEGLAAVPGIFLDMNKVQTNMVFVDLAFHDGPREEPGMTTSSARAEAVAPPGTGPAEVVCAALAQRRVLAGAVGPARIRFVTHKDVSREGVERAVVVFSEVLAGFRAR